MESFFGIGILELFFIAVIALIVLGPERLPGAMREGANYVRKLRQMGNELTSQFSEELKALDELNPKRIFNEVTDPNRPDPNDKTKPTTAKTPTPAKPAAKPASTAPAKTTATKPATAQTTAAAASTPAASAAVTDAAQPGGTQAAPADNTILPPAVEKAASTAAAQIDNLPPTPGANGAAESPVESTPAPVESPA